MTPTHTVNSNDESYRVTVDDREVTVPREWTERSIDSVYAPWEDAIRALFRAATEVTVEEDAVRIRADSAERALVEYGAAADEADAVARLAVLDNADVVAAEANEWVVPAPDADSEVRTLVIAADFATVTEVLDEVIESLESRAGGSEHSADDDAATRLAREASSAEALRTAFTEYHEEVRTNVAFGEYHDEGMIQLLDTVDDSDFLSRPVGERSDEELIEVLDVLADALGELALLDRSLGEVSHEEFVETMAGLTEASETFDATDPNPVANTSEEPGSDPPADGNPGEST